MKIKKKIMAFSIIGVLLLGGLAYAGLGQSGMFQGSLKYTKFTTPTKTSNTITNSGNTTQVGKITNGGTTTQPDAITNSGNTLQKIDPSRIKMSEGDLSAPNLDDYKYGAPEDLEVVDSRVYEAEEESDIITQEPYIYPLTLVKTYPEMDGREMFEIKNSVGDIEARIYLDEVLLSSNTISGVDFNIITDNGVSIPFIVSNQEIFEFNTAHNTYHIKVNGLNKSIQYGWDSAHITIMNEPGYENYLSWQ